MKPIPVSDDAELERLLDHVAGQANRASDYFYMLTRLEAATEEYSMEMAQTQAFWGFVFSALRDALLSSLCRLYDQHPRALSLGRFLRTVQTYRGYFSEEKFRKRLQANAHVEGLATDRSVVDSNALKDEIDSVSTATDPAVSRLERLRHGSVAHNDADLVRLGHLESLGGLNHEEVRTLIDRAVRIAN